MLSPLLRVGSLSFPLTTLSRLASTLVMPVHPPSHRPVDWKSAAPSPPPGTTTWAAQSTLPKLPVLPLAPTLERLRRTLAPIAHSRAETADAERKIDAFERGIGPELQRRLEAHAKGKPHWLEEWWDDGAYLSYRDSVRSCPLHRGSRD
jgi:carnitine O-acetyltransferase